MRKINSIATMPALLTLAVFLAAPLPVLAYDSALSPMEARAVVHHVKMALDSDPVLGKYDLDVEMRNGVVRLYGMVYWISEWERATQIALKVDGYRKLSNLVGIMGVTDGHNVSG